MDGGRRGLGGVWEQKERKMRGERDGEGVWEAREGRGVRVGRLKGALGRYKAVQYLSKMIARRRRAKNFGLFLMAPNITPPLRLCCLGLEGGILDEIKLIVMFLMMKLIS